MLAPPTNLADTPIFILKVGRTLIIIGFWAAGCNHRANPCCSPLSDPVSCRRSEAKQAQQEVERGKSPAGGFLLRSGNKQSRWPLEVHDRPSFLVLHWTRQSQLWPFAASLRLQTRENNPLVCFVDFACQ